MGDILEQYYIYTSMETLNKIIIIGTGNVASQLAQTLCENHISIAGIYGRNQQKATKLAKQVNAKTILSLDNVKTDVDLALVCVNDEAIESVIDQLPLTLPIAYTSGGVQLSQFNNRKSIGVFYPLQTFTKGRSIDLSFVPFLIEAKSKIFEKQLVTLAKNISSSVHVADSEQRFQLHLAAVLVNNFSNHLYLLAENHLKKHDLDFKLLIPLIEETTKKIKTTSPFIAQTGPAKRNDKTVINNHLNALSGDTKRLYELFSKSIIKQNNEKL